MDSLKAPEMSSCFVDHRVKNKKREMNSCESPSTSTPLATKKMKEEEDCDESETSRKVPPRGEVLIDSGEKTETVKSVSHGWISVIGRRRSMEDALAVEVKGEVESYDFFAVYDGHGGSHAANMCKERLHSIVAEEVEERKRKTLRIGRGGSGGEKALDFWGEVMAASYSRMDVEVSGGDGTEYMEAVNSVGTTAVVGIIGEEEIVVANCGDSRAVLYRGGKAIPLSCDHKVTCRNFSRFNHGKQ